MNILLQPSNPVVAGLAKRHAIISALRDAPVDKRGLQTRVDVSRSTIDRSLRELREADIVAYECGQWGLTALGRFAHNAYLEYLDFVSDLEAAAPLLNAIADTDSIPPAFLDDVVVHEADPAVPAAVFQRMRGSITDAQRFRITTPVVSTGLFTVVAAATAGGRTCAVDVVVPSEPVGRLAEFFPGFTRRSWPCPTAVSTTPR